MTSTDLQRSEAHIVGLERRITRLEALSGRFSWFRLAVLVGGGAAVWLATTQFGDSAGRWTFYVALAVFLWIAWRHRRVEKGLERLRMWKTIREEHLARRRLDWANIPDPGAGEPSPRKGPKDGHHRSTSSRSPLDVDLDLTGECSLHHLLDCAASTQGSRLLAQWLTQGEGDLVQIRYRQALARELTPMQLFRDRLTLAYRTAAKDHLDGEKLLGWLSEDFSVERLRWALPVAVVWAAVNIALFILDATGRLPAYWTLTLTFYLAFYYLNIRIFQQAIEAITELDSELPKFSAILRLLERRSLFEKPAVQALLAPIRAPAARSSTRPSVQLRRLRWITAGVGLRMNPIMGVLLNLALPWDYVFTWLAAGQRRRLQASLPGWFEALYTLEAAGSLANYAALHPQATYPEIDEAFRPVFEVEGLGHPLIPEGVKVRNDFRVDETGRIAVITGSNMAGKSTFIKAIGVNLCLAYAGGPVDARRMRALPFRLHSCIRISDSIGEGYSYFYAEVICLKALLDKLQSPGQPVLFLIDEIFKGTNNRERLIGSRAYLRRLMTLNGVGFLSTHDLELSHLAEESPRVSNFHFRDDVQDGRLVFDYTIRPGPSPTTNALKIMALEGLPVEE